MLYTGFATLESGIYSLNSLFVPGKVIDGVKISVIISIGEAINPTPGDLSQHCRKGSYLLKSAYFFPDKPVSLVLNEPVYKCDTRSGLAFTLKEVSIGQ